MRQRGLGGILALVALSCLPAVLGSCGRPECSQSAPVPETTFVGQVTARGDSSTDFGSAAFLVESVQPPADRAIDPHTPAIGAVITVSYADDGQRFLRIGERYRVVVDWEEGRYESDVHTAEDCTGASGTTHADGSGIDTASVPWYRVHRALLGLALAPVVALAIVAVLVWRRRRVTTVRVDDRYL